MHGGNPGRTGRSQAAALPSLRTDNAPGCDPGGWHVNYLGRNYALASRDNANRSYWRNVGRRSLASKAEQVSGLEDLSCLLLNLGRNGNFPPPAVGMGDFGVVQKDNKLLALKGLPPREILDDKKLPAPRALQTSIAAIAFGNVSRREVWINDRKCETLSARSPIRVAIGKPA